VRIIDAHHHLWERGRFRYAWLQGAGPLNRDFRLADFAAAIAGTDVAASVFVQADADEAFGIQEARWVLSLADAAGPIQAVVAWAPVERPDLEDYLTRLGQHPRLKGVRRLIQGETDPDFCARPEFIAGVRALGQAGLSFDACVYHHQLAAVVRLAAAASGTAIVLDHLGKPAIAAGQLEPWRAHLRELATMDHVTCKLSGLVTEARWDAWDAELLRPYAEAAIEAFGFGRLMFGSDWPVCLLAADYTDVTGIVTDFVARLSATEQEAILGGTAARRYGLAE